MQTGLFQIKPGVCTKDIGGITLHFVGDSYDSTDSCVAALKGRISLENLSLVHGDEDRFVKSSSSESEKFFEEICSIKAIKLCLLLGSEFFLQIGCNYKWEEDVFPHLERVFKKYKDLIK